MASTPKTPKLTLEGEDLIDVLTILARYDVDLAIMLARQAGCSEADERRIDPDGIVKY